LWAQLLQAVPPPAPLGNLETKSSELEVLVYF